jgi:hypothetical protein
MDGWIDERKDEMKGCIEAFVWLHGFPTLQSVLQLLQGTEL